MKTCFVYILASKRNGTLYIGVSSNLVKRIYEHKNIIRKGFSSKYSCKLLVYYEVFDDINLAIKREKQLKGGSRLQKLKLIDSFNPDWKDLYAQICRL